MRKLSDYARDVFSQFGEDGIIQKIFEVLGTASRVCIEVGAHDGYRFSNTANLWLHGWKGVLIEADAARYAALVGHAKGYDCHCVKARVGSKGRQALEYVLQEHAVNTAVDFLSIDIDGDDYWVFKSLKRLAPRVVCCEYNPTIPVHMDLVAEEGNYFGCSVLALVKLAESKGYKLVSMTTTNCFFVSAGDFEKFSDYETTLAALALSEHLTYLITGYDGDYVLSRRPTFGFRQPYKRKLVGAHFCPVAVEGR